MSTIDFTCSKCGKQCDGAPDPPALAICPDCCEAHHYIYSAMDRTHFCEHCFEHAPIEWYQELEIDARSHYPDDWNDPGIPKPGM